MSFLSLIASMRAKSGKEGLVAELVGEAGIHAGGEEVSVLALERGRGRVRGLFQVDIEEVAIALGELIEAAPAGLVAGDGVVLTPVAAGVLVEVGAGVGGLVDGARGRSCGSPSARPAPGRRRERRGTAGRKGRRGCKAEALRHGTGRLESRQSERCALESSGRR